MFGLQTRLRMILSSYKENLNLKKVVTWQFLKSNTLKLYPFNFVWLNSSVEFYKNLNYLFFAKKTNSEANAGSKQPNLENVYTNTILFFKNNWIIYNLVRSSYIAEYKYWRGVNWPKWVSLYAQLVAIYKNDSLKLYTELSKLYEEEGGILRAFYKRGFMAQGFTIFGRKFAAQSREDWADSTVIWLSFFQIRGIRTFRYYLNVIYCFFFGRFEYTSTREPIWIFVFDRTKENTHTLKTLGSWISSYKIVSYLNVFYSALRTILLPVTLSFFCGVILLNYYSVNLLRNIAGWVVVGFLFLWLMSGFNFFLKRYRFGKFTSAIQRFWKRTNAYFWLIEGFLFLLFFYYYLNSSQEVYYMFDESNLNQTHLLSVKAFYAGNLVLITLIVYSLYVLINLNNYQFKQLLTHLTIITCGLIFMFLTECYQFYYIITMFYESTWEYLGADGVWQLNIDSPKLRAKQQYFILALIAKYWHFLFIFFSWLFVVFKSFEQRSISYNLFGVNLQNLLLLLILNTLFLANWLKWILRRFYEVSYYWFFSDVNAWAHHEVLRELLLNSII